jgi:hypothetical protein
MINTFICNTIGHARFNKSTFRHSYPPYNLTLLSPPNTPLSNSNVSYCPQLYLRSETCIVNTYLVVPTSCTQLLVPNYPFPTTTLPHKVPKYPFPTIHLQVPIANYPFSTISSQVPIHNFQLLNTHSRPPILKHPFPSTRSKLHIPDYPFPNPLTIPVPAPPYLLHDLTPAAQYSTCKALYCLQLFFWRPSPFY